MELMVNIIPKKIDLWITSVYRNKCEVQQTLDGKRNVFNYRMCFIIIIILLLLLD